MKKLLFPLILLVVFLTPLTAFALDTSGSLLYMECYNKAGGCGLCDIISLINTITRFILSLAAVAALVMFVWAGVEMVVSAGSADKIKSARTKIIGSLTGILIIYFAWVGVNFLISNFTKNDASVFSFGAWNKLECVSDPETYLETVGQNATGQQPDSVGNPAGGSSSGSYCNSMLMTSANMESWQCNDASADLNSFMVCLINNAADYNLTASDFRLNSISDNGGLNNCRNNYNPTTCHHSRTSCHYGSRVAGMSAGSYAIDLDDTAGLTRNLNNTQRLIENTCGGAYLNEGNHIHASSPGCNSPTNSE